MDTLDLRPLPGVVLKRFTARDVVSRWDVLEVHTPAPATAAARFHDAIQTRMPFPVRVIQVDGGSEFQAQFERACHERGIRLFVLPPRSPKLPAPTRRSSTGLGPHVDHLSDQPTAPGLEGVYNTVRPYQALGYRTPQRYLRELAQASKG